MEIDEVETEVLVERAVVGSRSAVERLLAGHRDRLRRMIEARMDQRVRIRVDPSDVIQEAFATASQQIPNYLRSRPIPFYPWLRRITWQTLVHVHEQHLDAAKRSVRREERPYLALSNESTMQLANMLMANVSTGSAAALRDETRRRVRLGLEQLSAMDREILVQRYLEQLSVKEIAAGLEIGVDAVYKRHARALERMRIVLEELEQ